MNVFYCPEAVLNQYAPVFADEYQHVVKVLRKKEREELFVFDGKGKLYDARIETISKKEVIVHVVRLIEVEQPDKPALHIAIAPPKNLERFEWFAEKATEIGVKQITPLICTHSERRELRTDRIEKVILSACKQSMHLSIPVLNPMTDFEGFIKSVNDNSRKYMAYCDEKAIHLKDAYHGGFDMTVLIGPEGDFTRDEVLLAEQNEFELVSLGKSRLRLETAGIFAAAVFNLANENRFAT